MKKLLMLLLPVALACGEKPGPSPDVTPGPIPEPTAVSIVPCERTAGPGGQAVYKGDCAITAECKQIDDDLYTGVCKTKE